MKTEAYTLPAYWASYLINGDASGLTDAELQEIDEWLADHPNLWGPIDCSNEQEFSHSNDANNLGGAACDFTFRATA